MPAKLFLFFFFSFPFEVALEHVSMVIGGMVQHGK